MDILLFPAQRYIQFWINLLNTRDIKSPIYLYCGERFEREQVTMHGKSFVVFGCSWTDMSVLGSQVFGQALMESCEVCLPNKYIYIKEKGN